MPIPPSSPCWSKRARRSISPPRSTSSATTWPRPCCARTPRASAPTAATPRAAPCGQQEERGRGALADRAWGRRRCQAPHVGLQPHRPAHDHRERGDRHRPHPARRRRRSRYPRRQVRRDRARLGGFLLPRRLRRAHPGKGWTQVAARAGGRLTRLSPYQASTSPSASARWDVLAEADHVAVDVLHVHFLHSVVFQPRRRQDRRIHRRQFPMQPIDVLDPDIGVEGIALPVSVRAAASRLHARQLYGDAIALHDHEDRRMLEVGTDLEAETVAVILRGAHDVRDQKMRSYPLRFGRHGVAQILELAQPSTACPTGHASSAPPRPCRYRGFCSSGRKSRTSFMRSIASTASISASHCAAPSTGAIRSRHLPTTSTRGIGLAAVPRTARTCSLSSLPSASTTVTFASRTRRSSSASGTSSTLARWASTDASRMRATSCAASNETVPSTSMMATICWRQMSGISRLSTTEASRVPSRTTTLRTAAASNARRFAMSSSASSGAWIGEPTDHFLMLVRITS